MRLRGCDTVGSAGAVATKTKMNRRLNDLAFGDVDKGAVAEKGRIESGKGVFLEASVSAEVRFDSLR